MKLVFVNHSSVIVETAGRRVLCDLWLDGRAFDDGWALLAKSALGYDDLGSITDLWFSHEHPDHFNPPNLKRVPEATRRAIRVLYQTTIDHRVIDFCRGLGFGSVVELPTGWWSLGPGVEVMCRPHAARWGEGDSWLAIRSEGKTILNVNDCEIDSVEQARAIAEAVGPVDVLLSQFSYASWQGNEEAVAGRRKHARDLLDRLKMRIEVFRPSHVIPFASFVRFCHEENAYLNRDMNSIDEVVRFLERETPAKVVVMYPGDEWVVGAQNDNTSALARYGADAKRAEAEPLAKSATVPEAKLREEAAEFARRLTDGTDPRVTRLYLGLKTLESSGRKLDLDHLELGLRALAAPLGGHLPPAWIWVSDHARAYRFDLDRGLVPESRPREQCDIELGSGALSYGFRFPWGGETLQVNGRFREPAVRDDAERWTRANRLLTYFRLARRRGFGYEPSAAVLAHAVGERLRAKLGRVLGR